MDAMPFGIPTPRGDLVKILETAYDAKHVENITVPITEPLKHLPKGVSETEDEIAAHWFIGSVDCGTTSSRFLIFNGEGNPVASHQIEFTNLFPESGYATQLLLLTTTQLILRSQVARA